MRKLAIHGCHVKIGVHVQKSLSYIHCYCGLELDLFHLEWNWWLSAPISTSIPTRILAFQHLRLKLFTLIWFGFNLKVVFDREKTCKMIENVDYKEFTIFLFLLSESHRSQWKLKEKRIWKQWKKWFICVYVFRSYKPKILVEAGVGKMWLYEQRTSFTPMVLKVGPRLSSSVWELERNANYWPYP